jgi:DUF4097 and DUF4098 domain-containing protein YvlB
MFRLSAAVIILLGAVSQVQAEEYSKSYAVSGRPTVHVHVDDSRVRVVTSDTRQVDFNVKREGTSGLELGRGLKINSQQDGDHVELSVVHQPGIAIMSTDRHLMTEVHMPRDADLQIETRDGSVDLAAVNGSVTIHSTDGAINASQLTGKIEIQSVDGAIVTDSLKGDVHLHSTDGAITVTHFDGQCDVTSTDGALRAEGRFDSLRLVSTDGSVVARVAEGSRMTSAWSIRTVDGSVNVLLPQSFQANINASTRDGHIKLALPVTVQGEISQSRVQGTLNGGGPELTLKSTDGSIRLGSL